MRTSRKSAGPVAVAAVALAGAALFCVKYGSEILADLQAGDDADFFAGCLKAAGGVSSTSDYTREANRYTHTEVDRAVLVCLRSASGETRDYVCARSRDGKTLLWRAYVFQDKPVLTAVKDLPDEVIDMCKKFVGRA